MICCVPYGAILTVVLYAAFCLIIATQLPECILNQQDVTRNNTTTTTDDDDDNVAKPTLVSCDTEGVPNTVLAWSTSYFVANMVGFLALHLLFQTTHAVKWWAGSTFAFLALGHVCAGITSKYYGNSGTDDGHGIRGYYWGTAFQYLLWTMSILLMGSLVQRASSSSSLRSPYTSAATAIRNGNYDQESQWCGRYVWSISLALLVMVGLSIVLSCTIIIATAGNGTIIVDTVVDEYEPDPSMVPISLNVLRAAVGVWNASSVVFWVSTAFILGRLALHQQEPPRFVAGLPVSLAAAGMVISQVIMATLRVVVLAVSNQQDVTKIETAFPIILHLGMLMTAYFGHNLIYAFFDKGHQKFECDLDSDDESGEFLSTDVTRRGGMQNEEVHDLESQQFQQNDMVDGDETRDPDSSTVGDDDEKTFSDTNDFEEESFFDDGIEVVAFVTEEESHKAREPLFQRIKGSPPRKRRRQKSPLKEPVKEDESAVDENDIEIPDKIPTNIDVNASALMHEEAGKIEKTSDAAPPVSSQVVPMETEKHETLLLARSKSSDAAETTLVVPSTPLELKEEISTEERDETIIDYEDNPLGWMKAFLRMSATVDNDLEDSRMCNTEEQEEPIHLETSNEYDATESQSDSSVVPAMPVRGESNTPKGKISASTIDKGLQDAKSAENTISSFSIEEDYSQVVDGFEHVGLSSPNTEIENSDGSEIMQNETTTASTSKVTRQSMDDMGELGARRRDPPLEDNTIEESIEVPLLTLATCNDGNVGTSSHDTVAANHRIEIGRSMVENTMSMGYVVDEVRDDVSTANVATEDDIEIPLELTNDSRSPLLNEHEVESLHLQETQLQVISLNTVVAESSVVSGVKGSEGNKSLSKGARLRSVLSKTQLKPSRRRRKDRNKRNRLKPLMALNVPHAIHETDEKSSSSSGKSQGEKDEQSSTLSEMSSAEANTVLGTSAHPEKDVQVQVENGIDVEVWPSLRTDNSQVALPQSSTAANDDEDSSCFVPNEVSSSNSNLPCSFPRSKKSGLVASSAMIPLQTQGRLNRSPSNQSISSIRSSDGSSSKSSAASMSTLSVDGEDSVEETGTFEEMTLSRLPNILCQLFDTRNDIESKDDIQADTITTHDASEGTQLSWSRLSTTNTTSLEDLQDIDPSSSSDRESPSASTPSLSENVELPLEIQTSISKLPTKSAPKSSEHACPPTVSF